MNTLRKAMEKEIEKLKPVLFTTYKAIANYQENKTQENANKLKMLIRNTAHKMKLFIPHIPQYKQRFLKALLALDETDLSIREEIFLLDEAVAEMHIRLRREKRSQMEKNQPWTEELLNLLNEKRNFKFEGEEVRKEGQSDQIEGLGIEMGSIVGQVQIILNSDDFSRLKNGRILVTKMTTPDLFNYFGRLKGIITDQGGRLCHAAILARDLNIPCVVGCGNATKILKDDDRVKLDSDRGRITIMNS